MPQRQNAEVHDVAELVTLDLPPPTFYVADLLPTTGVMLLYGSPKVRKSWLAQYFGYCIATGTPFLGFGVTRAKVLMCQFEIGFFSYANRLRQMQTRHFRNLATGNYYEYSPGLMYINEDENFAILLAKLRQINPKIVILDCMSACFGGDENNGERMSEFISRLEYIKQEFEASIILVHHTNKNLLASSSVDRARGHTKLTGYVDTLMFMAEQTNGTIQLQTKSRQAINDVPAINIAFNDYNWLRR